MSDCIIWTGATQNGGYGVKKIPKTRRNVRVHRAAWEDIHGPIPDGMFVLHKCDNPACYNVDHLFLGTQADNIADMIEKGRKYIQPRTAKHGSHAMYNHYGCRCDKCRKGRRDYMREYRSGASTISTKEHTNESN